MNNTFIPLILQIPHEIIGKSVKLQINPSRIPKGISQNAFGWDNFLSLKMATSQPNAELSDVTSCKILLRNM